MAPIIIIVLEDDYHLCLYESPVDSITVEHFFELCVLSRGKESTLLTSYRKYEDETVYEFTLRVIEEIPQKLIELKWLNARNTWENLSLQKIL